MRLDRSPEGVVMTRSSKSQLHDEVVRLTQERTNVVSFVELRSIGLTKAQWEARIGAHRWSAVPRRGVVTHNGPIGGDDALRRALIKVGPKARLGGITALHAAGLSGFDEPLIHVWVPKSAFATAPGGVRLHQTRRWNDEDCMPGGLPRSRPSVATVQAALWSVTLRQAALAMVMPIQQRIVSVPEVAEQLERVRRHRFRRPLRAVIADIARGSESIGELDFVAMCRTRGLPEPSRQVRRRTPQGTIYLDVYWEAFGVGVEVNGVGHSILTKVLSDELRLIDTQLRGETAVQVSVLTLRIEPEPFFERLRRLLRSRGWPG